MTTTSRTKLASEAEATPAVRPHGKPLTHAVHAHATALNFAINAKSLQPSIPPGLTLDFYRGECFISLVCMEIRQLPFLGLPLIPKFCELSLRCFVSEEEDQRRQGVLYLKSYVGSKLGAWALGNLLPHPYQVLPIKSHSVGFGDQVVPEIDYQWTIEGNDNRIRIRGRDRITKREPGTKLHFILSHSSRYQTNHGKTHCYHVERPSWVLWDAAQANFTCDVRRLFGQQFVKPLAARPVSVFVAGGSKVMLHRPIQVKN